MTFGQDITSSLDSSLRREWLETNGLGGFASSTIVGLNTRRYHGLLTASLKPPLERYVLLSKLEETVIVGGERYELSANRYPNTIHPHGYRYLKQFELDPFPTFTYDVHGIRIVKRVFMAHGENTTVVEYECGSPDDCGLELHPLIAFREYHHTTHRNDALNPTVELTPGLAMLKPYESLPSLFLAHNSAAVEMTGYWYLDFEYEEELLRGLDYREDLFNPFRLKATLSQGYATHIVASTEPHSALDAIYLRERETQRRTQVRAGAPVSEAIVQDLTVAADQFIVKRGEGTTVIAGYHWFSDWGRDTMIALPGLALATGKADVAKSILRVFAASADRGTLPNRFPDASDTPEYNTVDATLWFFEAIRSLLQYTADYAFVKGHLYECLKDIIEWHLRGTRYGIHADADGLLTAGDASTQLTWMDSKIGAWPITSRYGKPVEIQALWYNALRVMGDLAGRFRDQTTETFVGELANLAYKSFNGKFWNPEAGCLFDVVRDETADPSIRPNQILAVSLYNSMLTDDRARDVVAVVQHELLTPLGLRTLSPRDPKYKPSYRGGVIERDSSYHQGTVWPWLMGPFLTAYMKVNHHSKQARGQAAEWLQPFQDHLRTAGLGQISEIADADAPHDPKGCIAQAWSVSEILRAAVEHVYVRSPLTASL